MGKHSASSGSGRAGRKADSASTSRIERLEPASTSSETPSEREKRVSRPTRTERQGKNRRRKRIALGCLSVFGIVLLAALATGVYLWKDFERRTQAGMNTPDSDATAVLDANKPDERGAPFYMIIMGVDNREGETRQRSDTLIVARVDPQQRAATLVSIPRDTRVEIPGEGTRKINAANALGGPALVIETVQEFTGLPISKYVEIDFNGFKDIVDALGGVTVNVPEKIQDPKAGDYDASAYTIYAGEQTLNGKQALTFVRSRNFPDGDFTRVKNQQLFIKALLKETLQVANAFKIPSIVDAVASNITTNMKVGELLSLANDMKGMDGDALETITMPGEAKTIGGASYVIADEEAFAAIIDRLEQGFTAVPAPTEVVLPTPSTVTITVRNGAGIGGVAADATSKLEAAGFEVGEVGNANQFVYDETLIVYRDAEDKAQVVAEALGLGKPVASRGMYAFSTDILVVVGKDWGEPSANVLDSSAVR